jgi:2-polyprenyl-3-methyl-5-hydroxy-6-metoxy-1,4-benzoquinol methylase
MKQWYEELFQNYANKYDQESFVKGTIGEVDFIEQEIQFDKSKVILDIGCGTGRHAIELARRGYKVTGIDLSEAQLKRAKAKALEAGVQVTFQVQDARYFQFPAQFEVVTMICEGSFPLMETDEMNFMILQNAYTALKPGGKFIFTTLNGLFPLFHSVKDFINSAKQPGQESRDNNFDLMTFRDYSTFEAIDDDGNKIIVHGTERHYVPSEITWLLKSLGFTGTGIYGCKLGAWSRQDKLTTEDFEMLVISHKP